MAKIKNLADTLLIQQATFLDRTKAGIQYISSKVDPFSAGGPTDSYSYILTEVVRNRQREQSRTNY